MRRTKRTKARTNRAIEIGAGDEVAVARFWDRVDKSGGSDACWPWGSVKEYGRFTPVAGLPSVLCHRFAYRVATGQKIPYEKMICHDCDNPPCCNPSHLYAGSHKDNATDCVRRGRKPCGSKSPNAKLTEAIIEEIRYAAAGGAKQRDLARRYGIDEARISLIIRGVSWPLAGGPKDLSRPPRKRRKKPVKRLTEQDMQDICAAWSAGELQRILASKYGVTQGRISQVTVARKPLFHHKEKSPTAQNP